MRIITRFSMYITAFFDALIKKGPQRLALFNAYNCAFFNALINKGSVAGVAQRLALFNAINGYSKLPDVGIKRHGHYGKTI